METRIESLEKIIIRMENKDKILGENPLKDRNKDKIIAENPRKI